MKNRLRKIAAVAAATVAFTVTFAGCTDGAGYSFAYAEYTVGDGDSVTASSRGLSYKLLGDVPQGVAVSSDGVFEIDDNVADGTQVVLAAMRGGKVVCTAICTLSVPAVSPVITFTNLSEYIIDGEQINAVTSPIYAVEYSLEEEVAGISVNGVSGRVSFTSAVADGTEFTVVASSKGAQLSKTFIATTEGYVTSDLSVGYSEYGVGGSVAFTLDYGGNTAVEQSGVLGVTAGGVHYSDGYAYDGATRTVTLSSEITRGLVMGENTVGIHTAKNTVYVTVKSAVYISTAEELAAINSSTAALSSYYVLVEDIDLTDYLSDKEGGWTPIGLYYDVTDGTATKYAFAGTFDGNGHTISGLYMNRSDDYAYNAGLFGYITANGVVTNLNVASSRTCTVKSYSGGLVGVNCGEIYNCTANISLSTNEAYKVVGAFVGRNEGTIYNCYSLGSVPDGESRGSFCGINEGEIYNCYSVDVSGTLSFASSGGGTDCVQFSSESELKAADFSGWDGWIIADGALPALPVVPVYYKLTEIYVTDAPATVVKGQSFKITVAGNPAEKFSADELEFAVISGDGLRISADGTVNTSGATAGECSILITCGELSVTFTFTITE